MCICEIYFSQIGFYLAHFSEEIQWKSQKFSGALPQIPPELCPNPKLIIAIAAQSFSQNSKNQPANFSLFRPLDVDHKFSCKVLKALHIDDLNSGSENVLEAFEFFIKCKSCLTELPSIYENLVWIPNYSKNYYMNMYELIHLIN